MVGLGQPLRQTQQTRGPDLLASEKPLGVVSVVGDEFARRGRLHEGIWAHLARFGLQQIGELVGVSQDPVPPTMQPSARCRGPASAHPGPGRSGGQPRHRSRSRDHPGTVAISRAIGWAARPRRPLRSPCSIGPPGVREPTGDPVSRAGCGWWVSVKASAITSARLEHQRSRYAEARSGSRSKADRRRCRARGRTPYAGAPSAVKACRSASRSPSKSTGGTRNAHTNLGVERRRRLQPPAVDVETAAADRRTGLCRP